MTQASGAAALFGPIGVKTVCSFRQYSSFISAENRRSRYAFAYWAAPLLVAVIRDQLNENHFRIDDFCCSITDIIAPSDPFHWGGYFEIFSNIFLFGQSYYNVIE